MIVRFRRNNKYIEEITQTLQDTTQKQKYTPVKNRGCEQQRDSEDS